MNKDVWHDRGRSAAYLAWVPAVTIAVALTMWTAGIGLVRPAWSLVTGGAWYLPTTGNGWFTLLLLGSWAVGYGSYWWPRRRRFWKATAGDMPSAMLGAIVGLAVIGATLGYASFARCVDDSAAFFSPITWTLMLFVGALETAAIGPGAASACEGPLPLSIEIARLVTIAATFVGAASVLAAVSRDKIARVSARHARDVDVVVGLDELTLQLIRALVADRDRRAADVSWHSMTRREWWRARTRTRIVLMHPTRDHPLVAEAAAVGATVVVGETSGELLQSLITEGKGRRRVPTLRRLFAVDSDQDSNLTVATLAEKILNGSAAAAGGLWSADTVPRIIVRFDDAREARDWRVSRVGSAGVFVDALSTDDLLAEEILSVLASRNIRRIVIAGDAPLAPTLLDAMDWRAWTELRLRDQRRDPARDVPVVDEVTIVGWNAARVYLEWSTRRLPAGDSALAPKVSVATGEVETTFDAVLANSDRPIALVATDVDLLPTATRLARLHPKALVLASGGGGQGVTQRAGEATDLGFVVRFGSTLLQDGGVPDDGWTRLARHQHEMYISAPGSIDGSAARRPWGRVGDNPATVLPDFVRDDNLRQLRHLLAEVQRGLPATYRWAPHDTPGVAELDDDERMQLARSEHERWCALRLTHGWRGSDPAPDEAEQSPEARHAMKLKRERDRLSTSLRDWDSGALPGQTSPPTAKQAALAHGVREWNREKTVGPLLAMLHSWGVAPLQTLSPPRRVRRIGTATAAKLTRARSWVSMRGDTLSAQAGDWWVESADGTGRAVAAAEFDEIYVRVSEGMYARRGQANAQRVLEAQTVQTLEGLATAAVGDWIVADDSGNRWPVAPDRFQAGYASTDEDG